jgi:Ca-activated chloride channel homolog
MVPILITLAIVLGAIGVVYVVGSQSSAGSKEKGKGSLSRGATASKASRKAPAQRSAFRQPPTWVRRLPVVLMIAAVVCLGIAVAQFRVAKQQGTPVAILVIDSSKSMDATDVAPSRLIAAQSAAQTFLRQMPGNFEVALVSFADEPTVLVPPTDDHTAVADSIASLPRGKGTVVGDGLASAIDQLEATWAGGQPGPAAIVLLSDGRDTGSKVPPLQAAARAAARDVPVYTVVLGAEGAQGANTALLQQIADTTGASLSTAGSAGELSDVYEALGSQLSSQLQVSNTAQLFVIAAIGFAMAAAVIVLVLSLRKSGDRFARSAHK